MNTSLALRIGVFFLLMVITGFVSAKTYSGWVLSSGEVIMASDTRSMRTTSFGCDDESLVFAFSETVTPAELELSRRKQDSGSVNVQLSITQVCAQGQAIFEYNHVAQEGTIGTDISITPTLTSVTANLVVQDEAAKQEFKYQVLGVENPGNIDKEFLLQASGVTFIADGTFGQAARSETLATITITEGPPLDIDDLALQADERLRDSAQAFNNACEEAPDGTELARLCDAADDTDQTASAVQIAEAFDPHALSVLPAAVIEGGRIQEANVRRRLAALRGGETGISLSGIALAYNGNIMNMSWLPTGLVDDPASDSGAGSTLLDERFGFFINGDITLGDRNRRGKESGFDFDSWGFTSGIDYRFDNGLISGVSLGYSNYDADLENDGGSMDSDMFALQLYGTYSLLDDLYIDLTLGYSKFDFNQQRVIDLTGIGDFGRSIARGSSDADQYSSSLAVNYRLPLQTAWSLTTYGQFFYAVNTIDAFEESGSVLALRFPNQKFFTRSYSGGLRATRAISMASGILSPFIDAAYTYEGGNDGYSLLPTIVETSAFGPLVEISNPDRNFGSIGVGASWVFLSGQQLFLSYNLLVGESDTTRHAISLGFRGEF